VLSAAVMERRPLADVSPADWDRVMNLNLRGTFFAAKGAAAAMGEKGGAIVALADLSSFRPWRNYPVHSISKAGVVALTELLARSLAPRVRVNAVAPGAVLLPEGWGEAEKAKLVATTPLGRLGTPDDVVRAVLFLLENDYVTGTTLVVDGGRLVG
jgi:pteridine reductase